MEHIDNVGEMGTCSTRKAGGVLVRNNRIVADGFNGNLSNTTHCVDGGCPRCVDRLAGKVESGHGLNRCICVHIEQNIIGYCAKTGTPSEGTTLYLPFDPCIDCSKLVVTAGVVEIVWPMDLSYPEEEREIRMNMLVESGIQMRSPVCTCGAGIASTKVELPGSVQERLPGLWDGEPGDRLNEPYTGGVNTRG